jgi:hypothetical protein
MHPGKIYKIVSESTGKIYVGSTKYTLQERLLRHVNGYRLWVYNDFKRNYCTSFEILKYGNYKIELVEDNISDVDLKKREGYYQSIDFYVCVNTYIECGRPRHTKIDDHEFYTCYCGRMMQNKYKTRFKHIHTYAHKLFLKTIHMELIKTNPDFTSTVKNDASAPTLSLGALGENSLSVNLDIL